MSRKLAAAVATLGTLLAAPAARAYQTPFGGAAPWNAPVAGQAVDPNSAALVQQLWCGTGCGNRDGAENLNVTTYDFSFPVYYVAGAANYGPPATGTCLVRVLNADWGSNLAGARVPCNPNWKPSGVVNWPSTDAHGNLGSDRDAQMIVLNAATGEEYDLWRYSYASGVVTISNGNKVPGSYLTNTAGYPPSRDSGLPYLALLPVPDEVQAGAIRHALPLLVPELGTTFRSPATKTTGDVAGGVPAGTRYALGVSDADVQAWLSALPSCVSATGRASLKVLAVALRDYGLVVSDHAGSTHVQLADAANPATRTAWAGLGLATQTCGDGKQYPRDALDGLVTQARLVALAPGGG